MGEHWLERAARPTGRHACTACWSSGPLAHVAAQAATQRWRCDYCGARPAAPVDVVVAHMERSLLAEYTDPVHALPRGEGEFIGEMWSTAELLELLGEEVGVAALRADVLTAFNGLGATRPLPRG